MAKRKNIDDERRRQIKKLLDTSTEEEKQRIREACKEGQILRKEVEKL